MIRKLHGVEKEKLGGTGKGKAITYNIVSAEELCGHGRLFSRIELKGGASVGWHQHVGETEPYYIIEGEGIFIDNDGSRNKVVPGDVCLIRPGEFHSIENASETDDLVFIALIHKADDDLEYAEQV